MNANANGDDGEDDADHERALRYFLYDRGRRQIEMWSGRGAHFVSPRILRTWFPESITGRVAPEPGWPRKFGGSRGHGLSRGHVRQGGVLAQLQRANVGDDIPAVARRNLRGIVGHDAEAVGDHVVEITERSFLQPLDVIRRRLARESRATG